MAAVIGRLRREIRSPVRRRPAVGSDRVDRRRRVRPGAAFVREVFTGVFDSDMGLLAPDLGELAGYRHAIGADDVALFGNITPEFSRSVGGRTVAERARRAPSTSASTRS